MMFLFKGVIFRFYLSFAGSTNSKKIHHCLAATTTARNSRDATIGSGAVAFSNRRAVFTTTSMTDFQVHPVGLLPRICIPGMRGSCAKDRPGKTATKTSELIDELFEEIGSN